MEGTEFYFKEEKNISLILEVNSKNILGGVLLKKKKKKNSTRIFREETINRNKTSAGATQIHSLIFFLFIYFY